MPSDALGNPFSPLRHLYPRAFGRVVFFGGGDSSNNTASGGDDTPATSTTRSGSSATSTTRSGSSTIGAVSPQGSYAGDGFEWMDTGSGYLTRTYTGANRDLGLGSEPVQAGGSDKPVKETIAQISLNEGSSYAYSPQSATDKSFLSLITTGDPGGSASYAAQVGAPTPTAPAQKTDFSSSGSFGQAFSAARTALGPGQTFTYGGQQYSTATAEERPDLSGPRTGIQTLVPRDDRAPPGTYTGTGTQIVSDPRLNLPVGTLPAAPVEPIAAREPAPYTPTATGIGVFDTIAAREAAIREQAALAQAASLYRPQESTGASTFQAQYGITPSEAMQDLTGFIGAGGPSDLAGRAADVALAQGVSPTRAGIGIEQMMPPPSPTVIPASPSRTGTPLRDQYFSPQGTQTTYLTPTVLQSLPGNVQPIYEDVGIRFPLAGDTRFQRTAIGVQLPDGRVLQEGSPELANYLQNFGRMAVSEGQSVFRPYGYIGEPERPFLSPANVTQATVVDLVSPQATVPVAPTPTTVPQLIATTLGGGGGGGGGGGAPGTVVPIDPRLNIPVGGITSLVAPVPGVQTVTQPTVVGQPGVYTPAGPTVGQPARSSVETAYTYEVPDIPLDTGVGETDLTDVVVDGGDTGTGTGGGAADTGTGTGGGGTSGGGGGEGVDIDLGGGGEGTGTGSGTGSGTGTGTGTGTGGGAGSGTGTGTGSGTGGGTGTGTGGGTGGGTGTGTGGGTGPGGTEVEVQEPVDEEPEPTFECPPGYVKQMMANGGFTCVPVGMVRPTVGPYYQPQPVANLQGYRPIRPGASRRA